MINVHYAKRIRNPFTTSFSNADTASSFGRNFNITDFYTLTREFVCLTLQDVITGILAELHPRAKRARVGGAP